MKNNFNRNLTNATNWYKMKGGTYVDYISDLTKKSEIYLSGRNVSVVTSSLYEDYKTSGNTSVRDNIILCNINLIVDTSVKLWTPKFELPDLINEGVLGSIQGIERYDKSKGAKLSAYMTIWIKNYIGEYMMACGHIIKYSRNTHAAISKEKKQAENSYGESAEDILKPKTNRSGANKEHNHLSALELSKDIVSAYTEEERILIDKIHHCIQPEKNNSAIQPDRADIQEVFNKLPLNQQELIASYYKLKNWLPEIDTFSVICKRQGIPQTTARARIHIILNTIKTTTYDTIQFT